MLVLGSGSGSVSIWVSVEVKVKACVCVCRRRVAGGRSGETQSRSEGGYGAMSTALVTS